jgi:succinate-semialdehyde dehydrogenase / glutarate-semialdehyde dehydrogenase
MSGSPVDRATAQELTRDVTTTSARTVPVVAPFTGEPFHDLPQSTVADVESAAARARAAQRAWWDAGPARRRKVLLRAHDLLLERREELLDAVQTETGKTRGHAFEEFVNAASSTRYSAIVAPRLLRTRSRRGGIPLVMRTRVAYQPKGLVGVITPWNYPLALTAMDVSAALATGNAVVQKADDHGILSVLVARRAYLDAGLPADLWAVVAGDGPAIGGAVVDAADYVCFTGSTATGRIVAEQAGKRLIGASLELGGKNPIIVLDDADPVEAAADATAASFTSAGQLCVSAERIYVMRGVADAFLDAFAERTRNLRLGAAFDFETDIGSMTTPAQLERVAAHLADAVAGGAEIVAGGVARPDLGPMFVEPAIVTGVTPQMALYHQETFGAVVAVHVVDDEDAAVAACNDSEYGLNASVFSRSARRARRVAARIRAGSVNVNEGYRASFGSPDAPMGGMGQSGLGRRNGPEGMLRFLEAQTIGTATGLIGLPRSGDDFRRLAPVIMLYLRIARALRLR